uniref:glutamine--tRNA ligase n=1 Tax=Mucochytrium quahogii TaxID=96639 RepID=A0A7S2W3W0_9STRA|mmetsp:Transcript_12790/g.27321  ORF Transcript_12790/g.27321 Transcript_12790/m.27321 type:complete len:714 (+) Transcript_12790:79-2220(+)
MVEQNVEDLLAEYMSYSTDGKRPENPEEAAEQKLKSEAKSKFVELHFKERGFTSGAQLKKKLDKLAKKAGGATSKSSKPNKPKAPKDAKKKIDKQEAEEELFDQAKLDEQMRKILGDPSTNKGRGFYYVNSEETLAKHLKETGGKWQTRFPPEPNGYLHIGHAKAMSINFGIAKANDGNCYMRFDDTNPDAEKQEYIDGILENVAWLGHKPFKTTYTSDYFEQLYELARELIRRGKAYVCFLTGEQVKAQRKALEDWFKAKKKAEDENNSVQVPFPEKETYDEGRVRSPEDNLKLFENMKQGRYAEGEATLRMKGDFTAPNPNMWDHMAYRIMYKSHPRTGNKWCIYPTYDYSHCLVDSIENITHSLCTLEFETRQAPNASYHWLLDALDMYHPKTWESSRCSISYNVMSKRRLQKLIQDKLVSGWDDPRLLTLAGLRRRGYTPSSVNAFCTRIGIARSSNEVCVKYGVLQACLRSELDHDAMRRLAVMSPLKIVITNFSQATKTSFLVPNHPAKGREDCGNRQVDLTEVIYIPSEKFRTELIKGFKGMVPNTPQNNSIRLMNAVVVTYESHTVDEEGKVSEVRVKLELDPEYKTPKGISVVTWVPSTAVKAEARIYDRLFVGCEIDGAEVHAEKAAKEQNVDFVELLNKDSLHVEEILIEPSILSELGKNLRWQFITVGYFCEDLDSTAEHPIFNLTVSLKEDKGKALLIKK